MLDGCTAFFHQNSTSWSRTITLISWLICFCRVTESFSVQFRAQSLIKSQIKWECQINWHDNILYHSSTINTITFVFTFLNWKWNLRPEGNQLLPNSSMRIKEIPNQCNFFKDAPGIPKSDLLGVTVALIHVAGQRFWAVWNGLNQRRYPKLHNIIR